jgi:hypothetical protein
MKHMLKSELWKALHNVYFYIALAIGFAIIVVNVIENYISVSRLWESTLYYMDSGMISGSSEGLSLFLKALPYNKINYASRLFMTVWPILAAMPYGWSYCAERRGGLYNQIVTRSHIGTYYASKYVAVFVSGGLAVALPMLADLLINALICPDHQLDVAMSLGGVYSGSFLSVLFYTDPWIYSFIWCAVVFFSAGAVAGLCFVIGTKLRLQVLVILTPFALLMLWDVIYNNVLYNYLWSYLPQVNIDLSPMRMISAVGTRFPEGYMAMLICGITALGAGVGYWQVKRNELV